MKFSSDSEVLDILAKVRQREDVAFAELVKRYTPMINKVISGFYNPSIRFDEAFAEACVGLYRAALSYDFSRSDITFGLYARICIYRRMCDFFGKSGAGDYALIDDFDIETFSVSSSVENGIVGREVMKKSLARAKEILSAYEYDVFLLYLKGYDTAEIALELKRSAKSVDNAKARLFRRLREHKNSFPTFY